MTLPGEKTPEEIRAARIAAESEAQRLILEANQRKADLETERFGTGDQG